VLFAGAVAGRLLHRLLWGASGSCRGPVRPLHVPPQGGTLDGDGW
jgi:hypothetical protein